MIPRRLLATCLLVLGLVVAGCTTTDEPMSEKERAKLEREMQKNSRQRNQSPDGMTREARQPGTRR